jgi:hypothetical protein
MTMLAGDMMSRARGEASHDVQAFAQHGGDGER